MLDLRLVNASVLNHPCVMAKTSKKASAHSVTDTTGADLSAFLAVACTNTAVRRAARRLGSLYDEALEPVGLKATPPTAGRCRHCRTWRRSSPCRFPP
jgi:hypothetical protein